MNKISFIETRFVLFFDSCRNSGDISDQFHSSRFEKENYQNIHHYALIPPTIEPILCLTMAICYLFNKNSFIIQNS